MASCSHTRLRRPVGVLASVALLVAACQATPNSAASDPVVAGDSTPVVPSADAPGPAVPTPEVPTPEPEPTARSAPALPEPTLTPTSPPVPTPTPVPATIDELLALSSLDPIECPPDVQDRQVSCSVATVPLDTQRPVVGENVQLMVAYTDNGDPHGVGPVVFLQGGPGVGSITSAPNFVGAAHDVLFVDQRGTGYSTPKLSCPEVDDLWVAQYTDDEAVRVPEDELILTAAYRSCAERLAADGIDFDLFNTTASATDFELIRQLFGYEQWAIWGISYGTRLGLTLLRDHRTGVRSAVLDSNVPFEVDFFATIPQNGMRAITALDAACDVDRCVTDHGEFLDNLSGLVLRLEQEPVVVTATRPETGERFPFRVDGETLINLVFTQLYSTRSLRSLPRQIARFDTGGVDEIVARFVSRRDPTQFDLSIGLYYTTWCREEIPFFDDSADDAVLVSLEAQFGDAVADALSSDGVDQFCDFFEVAAASPVEDEPLVSAVPALVFAGAFDPITPPSWSQQVAAALTNTTYVELADHGHGMTSSCTASIRLAFLIDPTSAPDTSCADDTGPPNFE